MNNPAYQVAIATESSFLNDDMGSFLTVGANYDNGALLATVEFAKRSVEDAKAIANLTGAYATVGYRFGGFTPYITYQAQETDDKNRTAGVNSDFNALSLGGKYEFAKSNVAIKVEVTNFEFGKNGARGYRNTITNSTAWGLDPSATLPVKSAKVLNLTLETIF